MMATLSDLVVIFLFSIVSVVGGYDVGMNYIGKVRKNPKDVTIRLARLDLASYLLTSVPLVGGLMILYGKDPGTFPPLEIPKAWSDITASALGLIAGFGIGLGIARRRWVLKVATGQQG
jgi:hypothetical protein